jgi:hypothetical protein
VSGNVLGKEASSTSRGDRNGPYSNPYNDVPLPFTWPGQPSQGQETPSPQPATPFEYGGPASAYYQAPAWIPNGQHTLVNSLPKQKQNGKSPLGDIDCPHLPNDGLPGGPSYPALPTGATKTGGSTRSTTLASPTKTAPSGSCPTMPDTGVTRTYELDVAYQTIAPDGATRNGLTINGQFPGPLVEANWRDW